MILRLNFSTYVCTGSTGPMDMSEDSANNILTHPQYEDSMNGPFDIDLFFHDKYKE